MLAIPAHLIANFLQVIFRDSSALIDVKKLENFCIYVVARKLTNVAFFALALLSAKVGRVGSPRRDGVLTRDQRVLTITFALVVRPRLRVWHLSFPVAAKRHLILRFTALLRMVGLDINNLLLLVDPVLLFGHFGQLLFLLEALGTLLHLIGRNLRRQLRRRLLQHRA